MIAVRNDVFASTGGQQVPADESLLTRQFYFAGSTANEETPETQLWRLAGGERDSCVLVVRDEVEPCIGAGLRTWFEGDAKEAQFFILRCAQDWKTIYRLLAHPAAK